MVFSNKDKILIKNSYQLKGYNARRLETEFWTKDGRYVAQEVQWTDVREAVECEVPTRLKTLTQ